MKYQLTEEFMDKIPNETELEIALQNFVASKEGEDDYETLIIYIVASFPGISGNKVVDKIKEMVTSTIVRNLHSQDLIEVHMDGTLDLSENGKEVAKFMLGEN